ncbi:MAG: uncharacterized protein A8A55_2626, partial [Amphiamblys sp. WSBS2006]
SKSLELEEAIGLIRPDVLLLQETLEKGELWVRGYRTLYEPAEDGAGKQGVGVAIHRTSKLRKLAARLHTSACVKSKGYSASSRSVPCTCPAESRRRRPWRAWEG